MPIDPKRLVAALAAPTPRPAQPEDTITPGQMTGLQYSRDRYNDGSYQVSGGADPSVTSFMGAIDKAPDGQFINYPTFWDGRVMQDAGGQDDGQLDYKGALARALQYEAQTGKQFARYPTVDAAEAGEQVVHKIMEQDASRVLAWPESQRRLQRRSK